MQQQSPEGGVDATTQSHCHQRRRHKKVKLGENSGLSEEQRRALRREQRELTSLQVGIGAKEDYDIVHKKNNELFEQVRFTREAFLDAKNLDMIAAKYVKAIDYGVQGSGCFNEMRFIHKLKSSYTAKKSSHSDDRAFFDWDLLDVKACIRFKTIPSRVSFLIGPLQNSSAAPTKARKRRCKTNVPEETGEEECPEVLALEQQKRDADQLSQAERNMLKMKRILARKSNAVYEERRSTYEAFDPNDPTRVQARRNLEERGNEIDAIQFLMNPNSFTQSVENILNASFMVKKGEAKFKVRKQPTLASSDSSMDHKQGSSSWVIGYTGSVGEEEWPISSTQCVMSFTMADWSRLCGFRKLKQGNLPHRKSNITPSGKSPLPADGDEKSSHA